MNAGALITTAARSAAPGVASEPGVSLLPPGKGGATGQVDAFTQALAALLGLPAQPAPQGGATNAAPSAPSAAAPQDLAAASAFTPLPPAHAFAAEGAAAPHVATPVLRPFVQPNSAPKSDQPRLDATLAQTSGAATDAAGPAQPQAPAGTPAALSERQGARTASLVLPGDSALRGDQTNHANLSAAAAPAARTQIALSTAQASLPAGAQPLLPQTPPGQPTNQTAQSAPQGATKTAMLTLPPAGAAGPAQPQAGTQTAQANPPAAAQTLLSQTAPLATPVAGLSLASFSLAGRIQSQIVTTPSSVAAVSGPAGAPSTALAPLAAGAGRLDLMLQPASATTAKPAPPAQGKTAGKTDAVARGTQSASLAPAEDGPAIEALHAATNSTGDQGQPSGEHTSSEAAAQSQGAAHLAVGASSNAAAAPLNGAPGVTVAQGAASLPAAPAAPIASQIATQVVKAVGSKSTHFDITLEPAGLGRVDVKLQLDAQGQVTAQFSFDNAHAAADAKAQAGQLQQALEQAGFTVGQGGLSFDVGGQGAGLARQDAQPSPQPAAGPTPIEPSTTATAVAAQAFIRSPASGLDITI
jgi:flagellar hook-length control protein FliK